jgi:glycosyltransferase involved in cell wall biosynthesis
LPSSIEGFPLSILEAMAMRVAVVASDVGAVAEVVEDGKDGFVVRPGNVEDMVSAIGRLADDHKLLVSVKKNARQKVESKYSNVILGRNYKKLYEDFSK